MRAELAKRALMANRDISNQPPNPFQDCRDEVHIAIFFDGTGNNKDADAKEKKWSNIARLFEAAYRASQENRLGKIYPIYISGVGTKFNGDAINWLDRADIWVEDNVTGAGVGAGGDRRMEHGADLLNDHLRNVMIAGAKNLGGIVAKYAAQNSSKSFRDLNGVLSKHRLIKSINISIFGFSRGAALARAFSNRLIKKCTKTTEGLVYEGYPFRLAFMGLFDTVASFGLPSENVQPPFIERDLVISPMVERCIHYVAAHELRFSFPVDLIRKNGRISGNWTEKVFPGVHSDVGGGYAPTEQGVDDNFARIPLREMLREAVLSGVRILGYDDLERLQNKLFQERYECRKSTEFAYARYMEAYGVNNGTVEQQINAHMKLYYSAYGTMYRRGDKTTWDRMVSSSLIRSLLGPKGMAAEVTAWRRIARGIKRIRVGGASTSSFAQYLELRRWQLAAWDMTASDGVVGFVSRYVHDSKADFLLNAEPFSYFSYRGVEESSISIWQKGALWLDDKGGAIGSAVYDATERGKANARALGVAAEEVTGEATNAARKVGAHAVDFANSTVTQTTEVASKAYMAAADATDRVIAEGQEIVNEIENTAERVYERGASWLRKNFN
jgi:hypothetical protein